MHHGDKARDNASTQSLFCKEAKMTGIQNLQRPSTTRVDRFRPRVFLPADRRHHPDQTNATVQYLYDAVGIFSLQYWCRRQ